MTASRGSDSEGASSGAPHIRPVDRVFSVAEDVIYGGIALLLIALALTVLVESAVQLSAVRDGSVKDAVVETLDSLLLVFIVVELLFAVRATLVERELLAEPFLLVGIIASIKEIVVLSVKAAETAGTPQFTDQLREIGVLGVLVFLLGATAWLLRLKEREPDEASG